MLETEIKKLTAAVVALTAVMQGSGGASVPADASVAGKETAVTLTLDSVREKVSAYCQLAETKEERGVLTASIQKLLGVVNAEKFGDVDKEHYPAIVEIVDKLTQTYKSDGRSGVENYAFVAGAAEETSVDDLM